MSISSNRKFEETSFLSKSNSSFIEQMYLKYINKDVDLADGWKEYFESLSEETSIAIKELKGPSWGIKSQHNEQQLENIVFEKIKSELNIHKPINTLVHGDLWSGNAGVDQNGKGVLFDPASWWADCEVEIAMSRLFGGFRNEFYEEYYKVIPLKEGFEKRMIIYNFYHILNHANMFGGSYYQEAENYIKKILDM